MTIRAGAPARPSNRVRTRWTAKPFWSWCLRAAALLIPLVASMAVGIGVSRVVPEPAGALGTVVWYMLIIAATVATLLVVERLARRLLPLAMLLRLSLVFPDEAPSRLRVARRAGNARRLATCVEAVVAEDGDADPEAIVTLAAALNAHDRRTRGHSERVRSVTELVGAEMGLGMRDRERLRWAAFLHDIGKLSVPAQVLNKPGALDRREWHLVRRHPVQGEKYAAALTSWLGEWIHAIGHHHEHWDGTGYPNGLTGNDISFGGRIVAVTDAFETMTTLRSYNRPMTAAQGREELTRCAGTHFDPGVVRAFLNISVPRLRWKVGLLSWIAQLPLLGVPARAGAQVVTTAAGVQGSAGSLAAAMATAAAGVATPLTPVVAALSLDHGLVGTTVSGTSVSSTGDALGPVQLASASAGASTGSGEGPVASTASGRNDRPPPSPPPDDPRSVTAGSHDENGAHPGWENGTHTGWDTGTKNGNPPHGWG